MRRSSRLKRTLRAVVTLAAMAAVAAAPCLAAQETSKYHNYADMTSALKVLVDGHADLAAMTSAGKTAGGRDVWVIELGLKGGAPVGTRPGLLIAAGFEGDHLIGSELALEICRHLVNGYPADPAVKKALEESVVYIFARLNPDAAEGYFAPVKSGRRTTSSPRDDDNDGRVDEDGPEDLNKDGYITVMRVKAPDGQYIIDPEEPRLMKKADPQKGERGVYKVYWEGVDNDGDGFINEDPPGGTDLNRNFTHEYPYYKPDAGPHMVSERESRALMDWMVKHRNVAAILTFGESDNLISPPAAVTRFGQSRELDLLAFAEASVAASRTVGMIQPPSRFGGRRGFGGGGMEEFSFEMMAGSFRQMLSGGQAQAQTAEGGRFRMPDRRPETSVNASDLEYFRQAGEKYRELTGIRQALYVRMPQGAFFQYGYFQFGVPSFSSPGFGSATAEPPMMRRPGMPGMEGGAQAGRAAGQTERSGAASQTAQQFMQMMQSTGGGGQMARLFQAQAGGAGQAATAEPGIDKQLLKWLDAEKADGFVNWTAFKHPDLGEVEIGGFKPYAWANPPAARIGELAKGHAGFVLYLAGLFPKLNVASVEASAIGGGLFRVRAEVENSGFWPTALAQGVTSRGVKPVMVQLGVKPEDIIAGGNKTNFIPSLAGSGGRARFEWIIRGRAGDRIEVLAVSEKGGRASAGIVLK